MVGLRYRPWWAYVIDHAHEARCRLSPLLCIYALDPSTRRAARAPSSGLQKAHRRGIDGERSRMGDEPSALLVDRRLPQG